MSQLAGDWLADHGLCRVCGLALPRSGADDAICSRSCAGRKKESVAVHSQREHYQQDLLAILRTIKFPATICPGELSCRVLPQSTKPIGILRPVIFELAQRGKLQTLQQGNVIPWTKIRGPFRVRIRQ